MPSEGIVYRSGKKKLQKAKSKVSLADRIAQNRAQGLPSTKNSNYSARSGKSNKTGSDLESVDISHLTKLDEVRSPTPLPTVNPRNTENREQTRAIHQTDKNNNRKTEGHKQDGVVKTMPYKNNSHVLPPVNRGHSSNQNSVKNHGVSFPPIQNNNGVSSRSDSNNTRKNDYNNNERNHSRYKDTERDQKRQYSDSSRNETKDLNGRENSNDLTKNHSDRYNERRNERNECQRSSSRDEYQNKRRSNSRDRNSRRRSSSRDRNTRRRSQSRDQRERRRSYSRDKKEKRGSRSRDKDRSRGSRHKDRRRSRSNEQKERQGKSAVRNRRRSMSHDKDRRRSVSNDRNHDRRYRDNRHSRSRDVKDRRHRSQSNEEYRYSRYNEREDRNVSHRNKNRNSDRETRKTSRRHRSVSQSSDNTEKLRYKQNVRHSDKRHRHTNVNDSRRYSISSPSLHIIDYKDSDSDSEEYSRRRENQRFARSEQGLRDFKSRRRQQKARNRVHSENENSQKGLNIVLIDHRGEDSSSDEEEIPLPSNRTVYLRSKSHHRSKHHIRHKGYVSDMEGRQINRRQNRVVYYEDEPEEILVPVRNTLQVPRPIQQVNAVNSNQSENETLFYLVPANQNQAISDRSQGNMTSVNHNNRRIIRMANPPPSSTSEPKQNVFYSSDSVYGQEPLYDEYRQPIQQKYYNQHTNHYRHDVMNHDRAHNRSTFNQSETRVQIENELTENLIQPDKTDDRENSSALNTPSVDVNVSPNYDRCDTRVSTAEKRRAMKHLNELSNYNINIVRGKPHSPPMTDEALIKKVFNAEFQSEMDEFLRS